MYDHISQTFVAVKALTGRPIHDLMDEANAVLTIMKKLARSGGDLHCQGQPFDPRKWVPLHIHGVVRRDIM